MRAAIYTRVSTAEQAEEGTSLQTQRERSEQFAASQGWVVAGLYTDDESGKNLDRPDVKRLLGDWRTGLFDVVVVHKLDRLTRSPRDLEYLLELTEQTGRGFRSVTESFIDTTTSQGRMMIRLLVTFAGYERELILERTHAGKLKHVTVKRLPHAPTPPIGYRRENGTGGFVLVPEEAAVVRRCFDLFLAGRGQGEIARVMKGVWPRKRWGRLVLHNILRNPTYAGFITFNDIMVKADHEPVITEDEYRQVQAELDIRRNKTGDARATYLLSGVLICGYCGQPMRGHASGPGHKWFYYVCPHPDGSPKTCPQVNVPMRAANQAVIKEIARQLSPKRVERWAAELARERAAGTVSVEKEVARVDDQVAAIKSRRMRWYEAYESGDINGRQLRERLEDLDTRQDALVGRRRELADQLATADPRPFVESMVAAAARLEEGIEALHPKEARQLLREIVARVAVKDREITRVELRSPPWANG
ncbi:MAG: recombinase family protein [Bacillota bacterium]